MDDKSEIKKIIEDAIKKAQEKNEFKEFQIPDINVEHPNQKEFGIYTTNSAMVIAHLAGLSSSRTAETIVENIDIDRIKYFGNIEIKKPGFINIHSADKFLYNRLKEIIKQGKKFGSSKIGKSKTVIIDYSSPNIAKPMHVGHLRSTIIGAAICNLYEFLGYTVISDNHLGDWGTQFGIMIAAIKKYQIDDKKITIQQMLDAYIRFNKEIQLEEKNGVNYAMGWAREQFRALEDKKHVDHKNNKNIWEELKKKSLEEFNKIYNMLGIKFKECKGESYYEPFLKDVIGDCEKKLGGSDGKYFLSNGAYLINLDEFNLDPLLIKKADGATLYATRELATIKERAKSNPEKIIYVVGNEQTLHFQQTFQAAKLLGYISKDRLIHVKFGLILDENHKKLATREGRFIGADDLINQIIEFAEKIIRDKNPSLSEKERKKAAKIIGIGALKYNDLSQNRQSDIVFDWNKMLSFEGNSAPYILYTYVRLQSILRKTKFSGSFKPESLKQNEELDIVKKLIQFPDVVINSAETFQMNNLTDYLYELSSLVNNFYEKFSVLKTDHDIRSARLALIKAVTIVLKNGLNLLGIETLEKM